MERHRELRTQELRTLLSFFNSLGAAALFPQNTLDLHQTGTDVHGSQTRLCTGVPGKPNIRNVDELVESVIMAKFQEQVLDQKKKKKIPASSQDGCPVLLMEGLIF